LVEKAKTELKEMIEQHKRAFRVTKKEARDRAIEIMSEVGIPQPEKRFNQYSFQFSGGMRQRIVIAIALAVNPEVLICDEPTTALDVTIQQQILNLIKSIKKYHDLSIIFITHDLGVVANMADRVAVMYAGKIVEYGSSEDIFYDPRHPYTWALLSSVPDLDTTDKLVSIPGTPPDMLFPPKGDAFADRNEYALKIDFHEQPPFFKVSDTHYAATWLLHEDAPKIEIPNIIKQRAMKYVEETKERIADNKKGGVTL
jgi:oligopeptide transport system ATP-binding protein